MTDYVDGKAAWLAEGLPVEGEVGDRQRIAALAPPSDVAVPIDAVTVRPSEPIRDVVDRVRHDPPDTLFVTTARGRLVGTVDPTGLLDLARRDELP